MDDVDLRRIQVINDFARRSFRDVADQDYVLARSAFRRGLDIHFLSLGHQAVEKYLKAILLFNRLSTKVGHSVTKALNRLKELPFDFELPEDVVSFAKGLDRYSDRYFEESYGVTGRKLRLLDKSVWHIRKYCTDWYRLTRHEDGSYTEQLNVRLDVLHDPEYEKEPYRFRLPSAGIIEEIKDGKRQALRDDLLWNNAYYSSEKPQPDHRHRSASANPTLVLHPDAFWELEKLVGFSARFKKHFKPGGV